MLEVGKGSRAPSEGTYAIGRHQCCYSYCNYNAALMMILCFTGDIIHLFPYRSPESLLDEYVSAISAYNNNNNNCISDICSGILNLCSLSDAAAVVAAARVPAPRRATGEEAGKEEEEEDMEGRKLEKKDHAGGGTEDKREGGQRTGGGRKGRPVTILLLYILMQLIFTCNNYSIY